MASELTTGIYEIRNTTNDKRYVGSAVNFAARWTKHLSQLRRGVHHSRRLQNAWNLHGEPAFEFRRLVVCGRAMLLTYEQAAMDAFSPEYNIRIKAESCLGVKRTPEFCAALSLRKKGQTHSEATKRMISEKIKAIGGRPHTEESRRKMSESQKGKKSPHLTRLAASKVGVPRPAHVRAKLSQKNAKLTEHQVREIRRRYAAGALQKHLSEEYEIRQSCVSEIVRGVAYAWVT